MKSRLLYLQSKLARTLYRWFPIYKMNGAVAVLRRGDRILAIDRADTMGYCFPGGLAKRREAGEETVRRELLEETGLVLTGSRLLFRYRETGGFSETTSVYEITATGETRDSGEGRSLWLTLPELERGIYSPQAPILNFLKRENSAGPESSHCE